jgi:hypothetical protein
MLLRDVRTPRSGPATNTVRNEEIARENKVATIALVKFSAARRQRRRRGRADAVHHEGYLVFDASRRLGAENKIKLQPYPKCEYKMARTLEEQHCWDMEFARAA